MTPDTAEFLLALLNRQQLSVGGPDFEQSVDQVLRARKELQKIIDSGDGPRAG